MGDDASALRASRSLSSYVRFHALHDAASAPSRHDWPDYTRLVGGRELQRALENGVQKPFQFRDRYKRLRAPALHVVCGAEGAGKRTHVRAFCAHIGVNLVEVCAPTQTPGRVPAAAVEQLYAAARRNVPCLVLFHDCDETLTQGGLDAGRASSSSSHDVFARTLERQLTEVGAHGSIWTVFALSCAPTLLPRLYEPLTRVRVWLRPPSYQRPGDDAPADRFGERKTLLRSMLNARLDGRDVLGEGLLTPAQMHELAVYSHHTTPGQLACYLDRVFVRVLDRLPLASLHTAAFDETTPTWADFMACTYALQQDVRCILPALPEADTTQPYEACG